MAAITTAAVAAGSAVHQNINQRKAAKAAQKTAQAEKDRSLALIERKSTQARSDVADLFGQSRSLRQQGFQGALDVLGQTIPQQLQLQQQGNVGAQQALIQGLPLFQQAILGQPVDFSQLQPQQLSLNAQFAQQQLPQIPNQPLVPSIQAQQQEQVPAAGGGSLDSFKRAAKIIDPLGVDPLFGRNIPLSPLKLLGGLF